MLQTYVHWDPQNWGLSRRLLDSSFEYTKSKEHTTQELCSVYRPLSHYFKDPTARLKSQSLKYHVYTMRMRKYRDKNIRVWCEYLVSSQTKFAVAGVCGNSLVNFCTAETELFTVFDWFTAFQLNFLIFTIFQPLSSYYLELSIATPLKSNYLLFSYFLIFIP